MGSRAQARRLKALEQENARLRRAVADLTLDKLICGKGKLLSPTRRRQCIKQVRKALPVSERRVCMVIGQPRATQRYQASEAEDEVGLTAAIIGYATQFGRYGYRRITALLHRDGRTVNHKRVERI
jgi:putative transposase